MRVPKSEVPILPQLDKACGLDIHKDKIVCLISNKEGTQQHLQEFGTYTEDLLLLRDTLLSHQVGHSLLESTGIYWISLYSILTQAGIEIVVANPQQIKQIPKRKTDRTDARCQIDQLEVKITELVSVHYQQVAACLQSMSGVGQQRAQVIISEIGDRMDCFSTPDHLTAWAGLAPGNHESAGKRRNTGVKKGNVYLRQALIAIAWAAVRTKDSYWRALFEHLRKRMKAQQTIICIARRLLKVVYKVIQNKTCYEEKGLMHFGNLQQRRKHYQQKLQPVMVQ